MKRKAKKQTIDIDDEPHETGKKARLETLDTGVPSPRRRAFSRLCKFASGERIIGFYGGWPYFGVIQDIRLIRMSFGSTYMLQVRWLGFSGKKALTWISEFDVVKHNESGLQLKSDVC
jgi:hypothetical protein